MRLCFFLTIAAALTAQPAEVSIIPKPAKVALGEGQFTLAAGAAIVAGSDVRSEAELLAKALAPATGLELKVQAEAKENSISLAIDPSLGRLGEEGYTLEVAPKAVTIRAPRPAGIFYGAQSFLQLLPPQVFAKSPQRDVTWSAPCVRIEDSPRFSWRGALVDVGRHFMPKASLLRFIDAIAVLKINTLQLHLTDDQGWRVEIRKYPKLTEVGAWRKETRLGHEREGKGFDGIPHGGFYTQPDLREIVAYARKRHVNIVPEIEMPGHAQAAIAAYPELGNTGEKLAVSTYFGVNKNVFNVNEKTILFLQDVLSELLEIFPSKFIHVGGDECPKDQWKASPEAQARMKQLGLKNEDELQSYFIRRMDTFLAERGRRLIGWDEILEGGLAPGATVMSWRGIKGGVAAAKAGHDVVMSPTDYLYLDYYQSEDPNEPLAIGGYVPLEKVYSFEPVPRDFTEAERKRVLGAQGNIWTEYIKTPEHLEYMAFPRLAALAEVVWTASDQKNFQDFVARVWPQQDRWKAMEVNFRPVRR